jgi:hypothetical protein
MLGVFDIIVIYYKWVSLCSKHGSGTKKAEQFASYHTICYNLAPYNQMYHYQVILYVEF